MENDNLNVSLGPIYKKTRKAKGITQEDAAEQLQLGSRYVSDLERGKTLGSIPTLIKLCNIYGITPTYILQDYLDIKEDVKIDPDLIGYYSLNDRDKGTVLHLIEDLNKTSGK